MKRLSVQLSVVGAVLALGAAAIAYSVLSGPDEAPARETQADPAAKTESTETNSPSPIRVTRAAEDEISPSTGTGQQPSGEDRDPVRTVSHDPPWDDISAGSRSIAEPDADRTPGEADRTEDDSILQRPVGWDEPRSDTTGEASVENRSTPDSSSAGPPAPTYGTPVASDPSQQASAPTSRSAEEAETRADDSVDDAADGDGAGATESNMASLPDAAGTEPTLGAEREQPSGSTAFPLASSADSRDATPSASPASLRSESSDHASGAASWPVNEPSPRYSGGSYSGGSGSVSSGNPAAASFDAGPARSRLETTQPARQNQGGAATLRQDDSETFEPRGERARADESGEPTPPEPASSNNYPHTDAGDFASDGRTMGTPRTNPATDAGAISSEYSFGNGSSHPSDGTADPYGGQPSRLGDDSVSTSSAAPGTMTTPGAASGAGRRAESLLESGQALPIASDEPGSNQLEGQQAPAVAIEKTAPAEIQVNRETTFELRVRNDGNAVAENLIVVDRVPKGTEFISATPSVAPTADGLISWQVGRLKPGEDVVLSMRLLPRVAGEIGSVAAASFQAQASVRTICTQPALELEASAAQQVLIGESLTLEISVTNTGNGAAENVVIDEDVPEGFTHPAGNKLEHEIGTLQPQESRRLSLELQSTKQGVFENRMTVRGAGDLFDEDVRTIEITAPQLQVAMEGPTLRYLDRQATYVVELANPGTASAHDVELVSYLPKGMKYVTSNNHGQYDTEAHAVFWNLEELPPNQPGTVHVTVLPIEPGNHKLKTDVKANLGLQETCEHNVVVEGSTQLSFVISDAADPIEVGSETTYEVKVRNRGSKAGTQVRLGLELPTGLTPSSGEGPTAGIVEGQQVVFNPLERLGPGKEVVFKVHAKGSNVGDHIIRAQLQSAELTVPVTKEEMTRVYTDN